MTLQLQRIPEVAGTNSSPPLPTCSLQRVHLIGAAGSGMRALAEVLLAGGSTLTGSDTARGASESLVAIGLAVQPFHAPENVPPDAQLVIYSDAITPDNPERLRATELGIPTCSYFQMLGRLMAERKGIAVAGTHGKSTTTAMLAHLLILAGRDPTVVCGAARLGSPTGGRAGFGPLIVAEACEYRANFLHLHPQHAAILNVEPDHFDCYPTPTHLARAFAQFAAQIPSHGFLLLRSDCPVAARPPCRVQTFGTDPQADWSVRMGYRQRGCYSFQLWRRGRPLLETALQVPGRHQMLNATAASALAWENGLGPEEIAAGLASFSGLHRRLECLGTHHGITLLDDYGHHPTELTATLETVRQTYPGRQVWCVFQPHQISRTTWLLDELATSLENADNVVVAEIFRSREPPPISGEITAADLAHRVRTRGRCVADVHTNHHILQFLKSRLRPGDVLITMGAGDIRKICDGILNWLREDCATG